MKLSQLQEARYHLTRDFNDPVERKVFRHGLRDLVKGTYWPRRSTMGDYTLKTNLTIKQVVNILTKEFGKPPQPYIGSTALVWELDQSNWVLVDKKIESMTPRATYTKTAVTHKLM